jgi:group I intron endonuclease
MEKVIYKIINLVNDKFYVGSTTNKKVRFRQHRRLLRQNRHHCKHLQAAWNHYGEAKFTFEVVEQISVDNDLALVEDKYLAEHVGKSYCYNSGYSSNAPWRGAPSHLTPNFGKKMPEEAKLHLREAAKNQWQTSDPRTGTTHSEETKAKISAKVQAAVAEGRGGKFIPSEETRKKMSEALKGNQCAKGHIRTPEHRQNLSLANMGNQNWLGKNHTKESREKMSKPVVVTFPDGTEQTFSGLSELRDTYGISIATTIRACKSGNPIKFGPHAGLIIRYAPRQTPLPLL